LKNGIATLGCARNDRGITEIIAERTGGSMKRQAYFYISGCIFGVVGILHFIRIVFQLPVQIGTLSVPVGLSWVGGVVAFILCAWGFRLAGKEGR
jgi:hypothetical protein